MSFKKWLPSQEKSSPGNGEGKRTGERGKAAEWGLLPPQSNSENQGNENRDLRVGRIKGEENLRQFERSISPSTRYPITVK